MQIDVIGMQIDVIGMQIDVIGMQIDVDRYATRVSMLISIAERRSK